MDKGKVAKKLNKLCPDWDEKTCLKWIDFYSVLCHPNSDCYADLDTPRLMMILGGFIKGLPTSWVNFFFSSLDVQGDNCLDVLEFCKGFYHFQPAVDTAIARCTLLQDEKKRLFDQEVVNRYRESDPNYTPPSPGKSPAKPAQPSSGDIKVENEVADVLAPNTSKEFLNPEPDLYLYDLLSHRNNKSSEEYAIDVIKRTDFFTFVFGIYVWASKLDAQSIIKDPPSTYYSPFLGPVAAALKLVELHFDPYAARDGSITREKYITIMKQNPTLGDLWNCYVLPEGCGQWGHWAFNWREQFMNTMQYTMSLMVERVIQPKPYPTDINGKKLEFRLVLQKESLRISRLSETAELTRVTRVWRHMQSHHPEAKGHQLKYSFGKSLVYVPQLYRFGDASRLCHWQMDQPIEGRVLPRAFWADVPLLAKALRKKWLSPGCEWDGQIAAQNIASSKKSIVWTLRLAELQAGYGSSWPLQMVITGVGHLIIGEDLRPMRMCFSEKEGQLHVLIKSYLPLPSQDPAVPNAALNQNGGGTGIINFKTKELIGKFVTPQGCQMQFKNKKVKFEYTGRIQFHLAKKGMTFDVETFEQTGELVAPPVEDDPEEDDNEDIDPLQAPDDLKDLAGEGSENQDEGTENEGRSDDEGDYDITKDDENRSLEKESVKEGDFCETCVIA